MALTIPPPHTPQAGGVHEGVISAQAGNSLIFAGGPRWGCPS